MYGITRLQPLVAALLSLLAPLAAPQRPRMTGPESGRNITFFTPNDNSFLRAVAVESPMLTGNRLQAAPDLCTASPPCHHNATCQTVIGKTGEVSFVCLCPVGWTGRLCDVDIDECADSQLKCLNGAMCRNYPGGYQCYCVPGYLGVHCETEANECFAHPCQNEATCKDRLNGYECLCQPGFMGRNCERDIDECAPGPCLNGAICNNLRAAYSCMCAPGFTGHHCEINVDECAVGPCQNGGRCIDGINSFSCNCINTGFTGRLCETEIDDCASSPCQHNGSCTDVGRDYKCQCFDGYLGKNCEVDLDECHDPAPPCQNGATCLERSNASLYIDHNFLGLGRAFSYNNSAGYVCQCPLGYTGTNCETEINECDASPCVHGKCEDLINGYNCTCLEGWEGSRCEQDINECSVGKQCEDTGMCENLNGTYRCNCTEGFGGRRCGVALLGCDDKTCTNGIKCPPNAKCAEGSTCVPYLLAEDPTPVHDFTCRCPAGRAGRLCQHSSIASFSTDGFLQLLNQTLTNVSFDFGTTLNDSVLLVAVDSTAIFSIQIVHQKVELALERPGERRAVTFDQGVTDGKWRSVWVAVEAGAVVGLLGNRNGNLAKEMVRESVQMGNNLPGGMVFGEVYLGGLEHRVRLLGTPFRPNMNGCMRDMAINGQMLVPPEMSTATKRRHPSVKSSCDRKEQCSPNTCNRRGQCSDLWNRFTCSCERPYYGLSCEKETTAGTFNRETAKSLITVNLTSADRSILELNGNLSFRLRTLENNTLVFYLGSLSGHSYLALRLLHGQLVLQARLIDTVETIQGPVKFLADGNYYYVHVERVHPIVRIGVDNGKTVVQELVSGSPLVAEVLLLGGSVRGAVGKVKRQISDGVNRESVVDGGMFKGILQDVRLNGKLVPFFEIADSGMLEGLPGLMKDVTVSEVAKGVKSDETCKVNPCEYGGSCQVTWNDFRCVCPVAFRGKTCNLPNFCLSNECPSPHAQCRKLENDYECITNVTFLETHSSMFYTPTSHILQFRKVAFRFRTRLTDAANLLQINSAKHYLRIYIKSSRIQIEYHLAAPSAITIDRPINDSLWHTFEAEFLEASMNIAIDGQSFTQEVPRFDFPLSAVLSEAEAGVQLGGEFVGCMDDVRLGSFLLPVFPEVKSRPVTRMVKVTKMVGIEYGCKGKDVCGTNPCQGVGQCVDVWNDFRCQCDPDVEGAVCDEVSKKSRIDTRIDGGNCEGVTCQNGGVPHCVEGNVTETLCNCTDGFTGKWCEVSQAIPVSASPDNLAIILGVTLSFVGLVVMGALAAFCVTARKRRAERGTYSPSRQEIFGSRVEMGYVLKPPPEERLI